MTLAGLFKFTDICARCEVAEAELGSYLCPQCQVQVMLPPAPPPPPQPRMVTPRVGCTRKRRTAAELRAIRESAW